MMYNYMVTIGNESRPACFHIVCIIYMGLNLNIPLKYSLLIPKGRFFLNGITVVEWGSFLNVLMDK